MFAGHDTVVAQIVAAHGLAPENALARTAEECRRTGWPLAGALVGNGVVDPQALLGAVAQHVGAGLAAEIPAAVSGETLAAVDSGLARTRGVLPIADDGETLSVLVADPFDPQLAPDLSFALGRDVRLLVADPERVEALIRRHYGGTDESLEAALERLGSTAGSLTGRDLSESDIEELAGQAPVVQFVNVVLSRAVRERASDVHFEPFEHEFRIRLRIDGTLEEMPSPPRTLALPVASRLKVLAGLNIAERRVPQDGRIRLTIGGRAVDLRVSTLPTQFGESVVLRVLDQTAFKPELEELGLPAPVLAGVRRAIRRPNGIFVVTGPTGSGKTTTLYSCLRILNEDDSKVLTVEDPVEYEIDGVMQVPVNPAAGLTFVPALRSFLRQDPDIVMVGEIRDLETAQIAIQASLTGHLVLTTLHTNDAPGAVTRLTDMGVEPFLLTSTLEAVLAQRLVRRICPKCRADYEPTAEELAQAGLGPGTRAVLQRGMGCADCHGSGYRGRLGIFELLEMNDTLRDLVARGASLAEIRAQAVAQGMTPLREAALAAVQAGHTTVEEIARHA